MANKFDGDIRPLSNDPEYMGVVFTGSIEDALSQARGARESGMPFVDNERHGISRDRANLLDHLNLLPRRVEPKRAHSPYSLEYAMSRWPENFQTQSKPPYRDIDDVFPSTWGLPS